MVGASVFPNVKGRHLGDPYYFPLYAEAEKLNVPICVHMFLGRLTAPMPPAPSGSTSFFIRTCSAIRLNR